MLHKCYLLVSRLLDESMFKCGSKCNSLILLSIVMKIVNYSKFDWIVDIIEEMDALIGENSYEFL